jgi:hypothetical protein
MASRRPRHRRFLLPLVLAAVLAGEITGIALGRSLPPTIVPVAAPAADAGTPATAPTRPADAAQTKAAGAAPTADPIRRTTSVDTTEAPARSLLRRADHQVVAAPKAKKTQSGTSYRGVNHVWIPTLGINRGVQSFPCSRKRPPDAGVYRWGCAGRNNVYLLSHAWSSFKPLHDAYYNGRLSKGMRVVYADGSGRVHTYSVIWWRVVAPTTAASWAWASLSRPSMTLQTCVGANSAYRLMVRLVQIR